MTRVAGIVAALVLLAAPAFALHDNYVAELGVYFDSGTFGQNSVYSDLGQPFHVYFVVKDCLYSTCGGFEFGWRYDPAPAVLPIIAEFVLPPYPLNLGTEMNVLVGLGVPLIISGPTVLVDVVLVLPEPLECTYIQLGPATPTSLPGHPVIGIGIDTGEIGPMTFPPYEGVVVDAAGWSVPGVATIGCPGPVAIEGRTWGAVKALYE